MAEAWYRNRMFVCLDENCEKCKQIQKRYKWSDDETPEICSCNGEMEETFEEQIDYIAIVPPFSSKSKEEQRASLKKRSRDHYNKEIKEKKADMWRKGFKNGF